MCHFKLVSTITAHITSHRLSYEMCVTSFLRSLRFCTWNHLIMMKSVHSVCAAPSFLFFFLFLSENNGKSLHYTGKHQFTGIKVDLFDTSHKIFKFWNNKFSDRLPHRSTRLLTSIPSCATWNHGWKTFISLKVSVEP